MLMYKTVDLRFVRYEHVNVDFDNTIFLSWPWKIPYLKVKYKEIQEVEVWKLNDVRANVNNFFLKKKWFFC